MKHAYKLLQACTLRNADKRNSMMLMSKNKEFKVGDLVLVYTLKQHTSKLKKRGNGPYVIHDISTSGAVRLATLDGEQMLNWMSGCRIKEIP